MHAFLAVAKLLVVLDVMYSILSTKCDCQTLLTLSTRRRSQRFVNHHCHNRRHFRRVSQTVITNH